MVKPDGKVSDAKMVEIFLRENVAAYVAFKSEAPLVRFSLKSADSVLQERLRGRSLSSGWEGNETFLGHVSLVMSERKFAAFLCFQTFRFLNGRSHKAHLLKRNPRKVTWTVLYRRKHKKGVEEETAKKRTKKTQKFQRAVVGATLADIMAKRNQKPEVRKAQREQAIR